MSPGKYRQPYGTEKFIGSFDITVPFNKRILPARVRPSDDKSFYTITLNNAFYGHLMKDQEGWKNGKGERNEEITGIGKCIDEYNSKS